MLSDKSAFSSTVLAKALSLISAAACISSRVASKPSVAPSPVSLSAAGARPVNSEKGSLDQLPEFKFAEGSGVTALLATAEVPLRVPAVPAPINDSNPPPNNTPSVKLISEPSPISAALAASASALPSRNSPADSANASLATVAAEVVPRPVSPRLITSSKPPKPAKAPAPVLANKYGAFSNVYA